MAVQGRVVLFLGRLFQWLSYGLLAFALMLSLYAHAGVFDQFLAPTYGNTGIHQASARALVETGQYPFRNDFSYGGGLPNLYVPLYRFALAQMVVLTGLDFDAAQRWMVMVFALALPLGFFALGSVFGAWPGVAAAFLASAPSELLVYTIRPLPQGLGLVMLAFALALLLKGRKEAMAAGFLVALVHQEAAVFFAMAAFGYFVAGRVWSWVARQDVPSAVNGFWAWLVTAATYLGWHFFVLGNFDVLALAQFQNHEGGPVSWDLLLDKTGPLVLALAALGLAVALYRLWQAYRTGASVRHGLGLDALLLAVSLLLVGLFAVKNDVVGIRVFMDRFIVYGQFAFILLAAYGVVAGVSWVSGRKAVTA